MGPAGKERHSRQKELGGRWYDQLAIWGMAYSQAVQRCQHMESGCRERK